MRISHLFHGVLLFMTLASFSGWASQLEKHGSPQITEQIIALTASDQISKEIAIGKILIRPAVGLTAISALNGLMMIFGYG